MTDSDTETRALVDEANAARERGDDERAESLLSQAVRSDPGNAEYHRSLAEVLLRKGNVEEAIEQLRLSATTNRADPRTHFHLARVLADQGRHVEADEALTEVLQLDPAHAEALMLKGTLAERQGRQDAALAAYHKVLADEPDNVDARLRIAGIHLRSDKPENAAHILRSVCQCPYASPQDRSDALWQLGQAYGRRQRWRSAAESMSASLACNPHTSADQWHELADAWTRAGDPQQAHTAVAQALQLDPGHAGAIALAGRLTGPAETPLEAGAVRHAEHRSTVAERQQ